MMRHFLGLIAAAAAIMMTPISTNAQIGGRQDNQLTLGTRPSPGAKKPPDQLNTLNDLLGALRYCWNPPPLVHAEPGMRMTLRFSLNRDGKLIGPPQLTYATPGVSPKTREIYREAMTRSLEACTPFPLTSGLGGAVAGRPFVIWIVDDRDDSRVKPWV